MPASTLTTHGGGDSLKVAITLLSGAKATFSPTRAPGQSCGNDSPCTASMLSSTRNVAPIAWMPACSTWL